ncbi:unnamed protein product [Ectocarpus sp. CCAP 1310/34]|nr:unnamed protein product [Ectocarpus sp. CCAP 1310/34]
MNAFCGSSPRHAPAPHAITIFPSSVPSFLPFTFIMSQNQHRLTPSSSSSQMRPARDISSSGGGSSSSGGSSGSSCTKRRHTNGSGIGKNRSRRAAIFDVMEEEDENVDPQQAVADVVEVRPRVLEHTSRT